MRGERGVVLIATLLVMLLLSVLSAGLVLTTSSEAAIAESYHAGQVSLYAADAIAEAAVVELTSLASRWDEVTSGAVRSVFTDGPPGGVRTADGAAVDLSALVVDNPGWVPFAYGPLSGLMAGLSSAPPFYVVALAAADASLADRMAVRGLAFGPHGARKVIEVKLRRSGTAVQLESWQELR